MLLASAALGSSWDKGTVRGGAPRTQVGRQVHNTHSKPCEQCPGPSRSPALQQTKPVPPSLSISERHQMRGACAHHLPGRLPDGLQTASPGTTALLGMIFKMHSWSGFPVTPLLISLWAVPSARRGWGQSVCQEGREHPKDVFLRVWTHAVTYDMAEKHQQPRTEQLPH